MKNVLRLLILVGYPYVAWADLAAHLDTYLQACTDLGYFSGSVLVARKGSIILRKGYGLSNHEAHAVNDPHTKFKVSSLAKPYIALAIMQLQEKGLLNVHDYVSDYISDYPRGNEITIHHLLTHTSGIKNYTSYAHFHIFKKLPHSIEAVIDQFKHVELASDPGVVYKFSHSNYTLLSFIIEQVTGQPYYAYIAEHIFKPAHMDHSGYDDQAAIVPGRAQGYRLSDDSLIHAAYHDVSSTVGLGGFYSTIDDMYLFNQALDTPILASQESLNRMFTPYTHIGEVEDGIMYGYGWATIHLAGHTVKKHIGGIDGFSCAMYRFVDEQLFIVVLSNFQHALTEPLSFDLAAIVCGQPYEIPRAHVPVVLDTQWYKAHEGKYTFKGLVYTITRKGERLYFKSPEREAYTLIPASETQFFINNIPITIKFIMNERGETTQMVTKAFGKERVLHKIS